MRACNHRQIVEGCAECNALRAEHDEVFFGPALAAATYDEPVPPLPLNPTLSGRRVLSPPQHAAGLVIGDKHALVSADDAAALAVLRSWVEHPDRRGLCRSQAAAWESSRDSHEARAQVAPVGSVDRATHEARAKEAAQWAAGYRALVSLHAEMVAPATKAGT